MDTFSSDNIKRKKFPFNFAFKKNKFPVSAHWSLSTCTTWHQLYPFIFNIVDFFFQQSFILQS